MTPPLLMTKLYLPVPGKYLVNRSRLLDKLDQCLEPGCRLALISAPAGFGKTTLMAAWAARAKSSDPAPMLAWLSIDSGDNDPVIFWSYVIAALQRCQPGVGQTARNLLAEQGSALEGTLVSFINDLYQIPLRCLMVLDDYHLIRSPIIHQSLSFFVEHLPPNIHLLVASRTDPPLPLALLRGRGQLLEIRLQDLRFSNEDADCYLNRGIGLNLALPAVQQLNQKAEGWIAGLQMAALAMQDTAPREPGVLPDQAKAAEFVASFSGSNRYILDYLLEEVLNRQPESIQAFLVRTAIVDQLCSPLCDSLMAEDCAPGGSQAILDTLESCNLFLFPLDQQRYWYRYHQLFADLLRKRLAQLAPEITQALHRRAMTWYEQNDWFPQAIQHAFLIPDYPKAAALIARVIESMWGRGEHATLLSWLDALPDEVKQPYPSLLTFQVSMLISAGRLKEAEACIPLLERYIATSLESAAGPDTTPEQAALAGNIAALRTYIASFYGDRAALFSHAQAALQRLTRDQDAGQRCAVSMVLGHAYVVEGDLEAATQAFVESIAAGQKARKPHMVLTSIANLAVALVLQGNLRRAAQVCQEGQQMIEQYHTQRSTTAVDIHLVWGSILRERGDLLAAEAVITQCLDLAREQNYIWQTARGFHALARLRLSQGRLPEAESVAQAAEQWCSAHAVPAHIASEAAGLLAEVWLRQGKLAQAARCLQDRQIHAGGEPSYPHQSEYLAMARLVWLQGDTSAAAALLVRIAAWAGERQQTATRITALLLQALVCHADGQTANSLLLLQQALVLAEPEGYTQIFVDEGQPAAALLREARKQGIVPACTERLLAALVGQENGPVPARQPRVAAEPAGPRSPQPEILPLVEPLSRRETEILELIAEGLSNKEIAQKLYISLRTVKYYSTGLYNKLGVDSRMQAVKRARELGLL